MGRCSLCVLQVLYVSMFTAYLLSCPFPLSPGNGGVTVTDIHPGGQAHFHCDPGFQVRGHEVATCVNATVPRWSTPEPQCVGQYHASCGDLNVIFRDFHSGFFFPSFCSCVLWRADSQRDGWQDTVSASHICQQQQQRKQP